MVAIGIATPLNIDQRNFRSFSALSFTVVLQGTWEVLLVQVTPSRGQRTGTRADYVLI